jgi:NhaP-type Na+/H+ or K+/H+ antiporter
MLTNIPPTIYLAGILGLGIAAQWLAWRMRLPAIVLLLAFGFTLGQLVEPPGYFGNADVLFPVVSLAVGVILFEGGLNLRLRDVRETGTVVFRLVTVLLLTTGILSALGAYYVVGLSLGMSALVGALLTVSGPTVVLPLLRQVHLTRRIGAIIKWEGIVNDPIGAILAALVFEVVAHGPRIVHEGHWFVNLLATVLTGAVLAAIGAGLIVFVLRYYLVPDYLQNPLILALIVLLFAVSNYLQAESGLLAVTLMGVLLANQNLVTIRHVIEFKENLQVLLISTLFIVLAAQVEVSQETMATIGWRTLLFVALLIVVVRPFATWLATLGSDLPLNERVLLGWIHPRGIVAAAVASLFALKLRDTPFADEGETLVFVTFSTIVGTVLVYGFTLGPLARYLRLARPNPQGILFAGASPLVREIAQAVRAEHVPVLLVDSNPQKISAARLAGLPVCLATMGSEYAKDELELDDIGRLMAMTPNDEVNTLACMQFSEHFDSASLYQLPPRGATSERYERIPSHLRGRLLFQKDATFDQLEKRFAQQHVIKKTAISDEFTFAHFRERYGESALVLFVVDENGKLHIRTAGDDSTPRAGLKVIALVEKFEEE